MADAQVTCIVKPNTQSSHEHITHLGNPAGDWMWSREQVIRSIDEKSNTFYVLDPTSGKRADIGVVRETGKAPTFAHTRTAGGITTCCPSINAQSVE